MAEILVRLTDRMGHLKGDPVWVNPDGAEWGWRESKEAWIAHGERAVDWPGQFVIVKMPGESVASLKFLLEGETMTVERDDPAIKRTTGGSVRVTHELDVRHRRRKLDIDSLPTNQTERNAMLRDGEITKIRTEVDTTLSIRERDTAAETDKFNRVLVRDPSITR